MPEPSDSRASIPDSLDRSAFSGMAWSGAAKWSTQIFTWIGTVAVARILTPADYGLLTMATVFMSVLYMLSEFGIGTAVVNLREISSEKLHRLNALCALLGLAATLATALFAIPLGLFFKAPDLPPVLLVLGLVFVISSFQVVPTALLRRELKFRSLAAIDVTRGLLVPIVTFAGALLGLRYWALVLGSIASSLITTLLTLQRKRVPFAWPRPEGLRNVLHYSRHILIGRLAWVIYQDGDFAVAGRRLSQAAVGDYSLAFTLATSPIGKITDVLSNVAPSLFSALQGDRTALKRYFLNLSEVLCLVTFPMSLGFALVAADLVPFVLGAKWSGVATPLVLLSVYAGARSVTTLYSHVFDATRETRFGMWLSIAGAIFLLAGFIVGSFWGTVGIAAAWMVIHPMLSAVSFSRVSRVLTITPGEYFKALRLGFDGTVAMAIVVLGFERLIASDWPLAARLACSIIVGATTYVSVTWALHRTRLLQIRDWVNRVRG